MTTHTYSRTKDNNDYKKNKPKNKLYIFNLESVTELNCIQVEQGQHILFYSIGKKLSCLKLVTHQNANEK